MKPDEIEALRLRFSLVKTQDQMVRHRDGPPADNRQQHGRHECQHVNH
jgi:hypothetical protein